MPSAPSTPEKLSKGSKRPGRSAAGKGEANGHVSAAERYKAAGNAAFKEGRFDVAVTEYSRAIQVRAPSRVFFGLGAGWVVLVASNLGSRRQATRRLRTGGTTWQSPILVGNAHVFVCW